MTEPVLSYELKSLLNKIKSELTVEYPIQVITLNYLMYSILSSQTNDVAYWLSNNILTSEINILKNLSKKQKQSFKKNYFSLGFDPGFTKPLLNSIFNSSISDSFESDLKGTKLILRDERLNRKKKK